MLSKELLIASYARSSFFLLNFMWETIENNFSQWPKICVFAGPKMQLNTSELQPFELDNDIYMHFKSDFSLTKAVIWISLLTCTCTDKDHKEKEWTSQDQTSATGCNSKLFKTAFVKEDLTRSGFRTKNTKHYTRVQCTHLSVLHIVIDGEELTLIHKGQRLIALIWQGPPLTVWLST